MPNLSDIATGFFEVFNQGDLGVVMDFFAETAIYEDAYGQRFEGKEAIRRGLTILFDGTFGKPRYTTEELFCDLNQGKVLVRWRCDCEVEGKAAVLYGLDVLHIEGNLVVAKLAYLKAAAPLIVE